MVVIRRGGKPFRMVRNDVVGEGVDRFMDLCVCDSVIRCVQQIARVGS